MSVKECLRLEQLTHAEKIRHWSEKAPWKGLRLPRKLPSVRPGHIFYDGHGNIIRMPPVIGRPCFGQVTAYLRHGGAQQTWNPRAGRWINSRCMQCPLVAACESVAEERLRATPEIAEAHRAWLRAGGRRATWPKGKARNNPGLARILYRDLLQLLTKAHFSSCNDAVAIAHYESVVAARLQKDCERQRRNRLAARMAKAKAGQFDEKVVDVLNSQWIWRGIRHAEAKNHPGAPRQLKLTPPNSSAFDAQVWLAKTRLELRGKIVNDSNTAREMQSLGFELHRSHNALRDRVRRSLTRVALLERFHLPGRSEPVWPKFGHRELREELDFDPFGIAA